MKFTKLVASVAIIAFAANANAYSDGTLRRGSDVRVAQNDVTSTSKEVNININTNSAAQAPAQTVQQPTTVVEAAPVAESKAEAMRKARQEAEVGTEQKIVEKLEESRLQEERARADRLFGNKLDPQPAAPAAAAAAPVAAPVATPPAQEKPTQVTIEKVEIVQPAAAAAAAPAVEQATEPVAVSKAEVADTKSEETKTKWYVSGLAGNLSYQASNVHTNYGLGVAVGTILDERIAVELSYFYSNSKIDDINFSTIYHTLNQNDVSVAGKYYILSGKLKPYVGGQVSYIDRKYQDHAYYNNYSWGYPNQPSNTASTQAVNMGVLAGVDFAATERFMIGLGIDYNFNVMTMNNIDANQYYYWDGFQYRQLPNVQQLEKINFYGIKANAKFTF